MGSSVRCGGTREYRRADWNAHWKRAAVVVTAEDGTYGLGFTNHAGPVCEIVNGHFAPLLVGQDAAATEKLWDVMRRSSAPYGSAGLASYAISAVDIALWDLKGKLLGRPVYELLGGPQKESIPCYASNTDLSYGTRGERDLVPRTRLRGGQGLPARGPGGGHRGIRRSEELVARTREQVGPDVELMVDAWISLDVETTVRLGEALRPYRIKWLEDYLLPEDLEGYARVRQRLPGTTLASGEHWYGLHPFAAAAGRGLVDILQPDLAWCGGISAGVRICHLAEAHGLSVVAHGGMNYPWGQHLSLAMPAIQLGERSEGVSPPGVPLEEMAVLPGTAVIRQGRVRPTRRAGVGVRNQHGVAGEPDRLALAEAPHGAGTLLKNGFFSGSGGGVRAPRWCWQHCSEALGQHGSPGKSSTRCELGSAAAVWEPHAHTFSRSVRSRGSCSKRRSSTC